MKFKTTSGREVRFDVLPERYPVRSRNDSKSAGQFLLGCLIKKIYGSSCVILEEFPIPEERLFIDFYLPHHKIAFEYQGEQHDKYNKFFHGTKKGFQASKGRDKRKKEWLDLNEINLVEVRGSITVEDLQKLITESRNG